MIWPPFRTKWGSDVKNYQKLLFFCDFTISAAPLSHETRFGRVSNNFVCEFGGSGVRADEVRIKNWRFFAILHPRWQLVRTKRGSSVKNCRFVAIYILGSNLFARNEQDCHKLTFSQHPYNQYRQNVTYIRGGLKHVKPVVPHKAVAEVSRIGHYRRGELLWCIDGRIRRWTERWLELCLFGMVAMATPPTTAECSVAWCSL